MAVPIFVRFTPSTNSAPRPAACAAAQIKARHPEFSGDLQNFNQMPAMRSIFALIWCKSSGRRRAALLLTNAAAQVAGAGGIFGERRLSPPSCTHSCALSQKIALSGLTQLASSSVPAMIIVTFGKISASSSKPSLTSWI